MTVNPRETSLSVYGERELLETEFHSFSNWWKEKSSNFDNLPFNLGNQTNLFFETLETEGLPHALSQLRADLYGYYLEYIRQEGVIPFSLRFNQEGALIGDFYGNKPLVEMINPQERDGALLEGIKDLEEKIRNLSPGGFIFRASPLGWTNLSYEFTESQLQIFWKDNNVIRGLTLRSNIDLKRIVEIFKKLGFYPPLSLSDKELIKWIVKQNLVLPYSFNLEDFINDLGDDHRGESLIEQYRLFLTYDQNFAYYDKIAKVVNFIENNFIENKIRQPNESGLSDDKKSEIKKLIAFALIIMEGQEMSLKEDFFGDWPDTTAIPFYQKIFNQLSSLPGCAGGGVFLIGETGELGKVIIMTPFGPVKIESSSVLKCVKCPFCRETVDAKIVNKGGDEYIYCPKCHAQVKK